MNLINLSILVAAIICLDATLLSIAVTVIIALISAAFFMGKTYGKNIIQNSSEFLAYIHYLEKSKSLTQEKAAYDIAKIKEESKEIIEKLLTQSQGYRSQLHELSHSKFANEEENRLKRARILHSIVSINKEIISKGNEYGFLTWRGASTVDEGLFLHKNKYKWEWYREQDKLDKKAQDGEFGSFKTIEKFAAQAHTNSKRVLEVFREIEAIISLLDHEYKFLPGYSDSD